MIRLSLSTGLYVGTFVLMTCLSFLAKQAVAETDVQIPQGGQAMIDFDDPDAFRPVIRNKNPDNASYERFEVRNMPFKHAIRVTNLKIQPQPWNVNVNVQVKPIAIESGDVCLLTFWMRSPWSEDESGNGVANAYVQSNEPPNRKMVRERAYAGKSWQRILIPFTAGNKLQLPPGKANVSIHMGFRPQTVEYGGFELINYKKTLKAQALPRIQHTYDGRALDATWRIDAAKRIEQYRKADMTINVTDTQGKPLSGADIHVQMTRHQFRFGTAVTAHMLGIDPAQSKNVGDHRRFPYTQKDVLQYRKIVEENFNWVVLENDLKMVPYRNAIANVQNNNVQTLFRRDWIDNALTWLEQRNIKVRGHRIFNGRMPRYVNWDTSRREELRDMIMAEARQKVTDIGNRVAEWDCINHPEWGGGGNSLIGFINEPDFYAKCLALGRELAPQALMWTNEGQVMTGDGGRIVGYENIIKALHQYNQPPDGIGFMGHYNTSSLVPPTTLYERFERFAPYAQRMQYTELDITTNDPQLQADYLRDVLTVTFSHPKFVGIIQWGFWAGKHWKPEAALWTKDWKEKPVAKVYRDLVFNQWWTDETAKSSTSGSVNFRGFKGEYTITVTHNGKTQEVKTTLGDDGQTVTVKLD